MTNIKELREKIVSYAAEEKWDEIDDDLIPQICGMDDPTTVDWALGELGSSDPNVRDVAASILGKHYIPQDKLEKTRDSLYTAMGSDTNEFVRYRSAFALVEHGTGKYPLGEIVSVLTEASKSEDVASIAKNYLKKIQD